MRQDLLVVLTTLSLYAAAVASPGPNFALASRLAISRQRRAALGASFGFAIAATLYAVLTMTGLALVLAGLGWLSDVIRVAGGCYLIYLGIAAWLAAAPAAKADAPYRETTSFGQGLRTGLLVNLTNPKGIAFFVGLYAAAIPPGTALWTKLTILAGGFMIEIGWYAFLTALLSAAPVRLAYRRFGLWMERLVGTVLAAFGLRLLAERF